MKNTKTIEVSNNQIIEYLTDAAAHGGYCWDGVDVEPGTAVTCLKTIATATGLSYYRVKKCIDQLVEAGRITLVRHKCFAVITFCPAQPDGGQRDEQEPPLKAAPAPTPAVAEQVQIPRAQTSPSSSPQTSPTQSAPMPPMLNRAARRRLARQEAKEAARRARHICR